MAKGYVEHITPGCYGRERSKMKLYKVYRAYKRGVETERTRCIKIVKDAFDGIETYDLKLMLEIKNRVDKALGEISLIGDLKGTGLETPITTKKGINASL
jgi:hypothetical protein